jgi:hypothetical protein
VLTRQSSEIVLTGQGSEIPDSRFRNFRTNTAFGMLDGRVCVCACVCVFGGRIGDTSRCGSEVMSYSPNSALQTDVFSKIFAFPDTRLWRKSSTKD